VKTYYDRRAPEYDEWYEGVGLFAERDRPGWEEELSALRKVVEALPPKRTLDVACGTGYLTRHLRGEVTGVDQSTGMVEIARTRVPDAEFIVGDGLELPFPDLAFDRVFTGHFYGHLELDDRRAFLREARRVARELVVVDASRGHTGLEEEVQERILNDGSRWEVYKRYFEPEALGRELGGGRVLHAGRWFVVVQA
jgi:demethylmenaquinone methyltransferase/2-methoxy-6-polyprenyl-1,4-benzoquinol methylase